MRGNVNVHHDHPLRLAAIAEDTLHYFTGEPCFRGHVANRYAKTGRCVQCTVEDKKTWDDKQPAEYWRRRAKKPAVKRKAKRRHDKMAALYDMLVANGLPVDPEKTLSQRRQAAWRAFRELTSDGPIYTPPWQHNANALTERCRAAGLSEIDVTGVNRFIRNKGLTFDNAVVAYLASKVRRARNKQQRKERKVERRERQVAQQQRDEKLREIAAATGTRLQSLRGMTYRGLSFDAVKAKAERMQLGRQRRATAKANGIAWDTVNARVYTFGWDWQRAITEKPTAHLPQPNSVSGRARANGIAPNIALSRIAQGWSHDDAVSKPIQPNDKGYSAQARAHGIRPSVVHNRVAQGWSRDKAISTPVAEIRNAGISRRARESGMSPKTVMSRLYNGWSPEKALNTPLRERESKLAREAKEHNIPSAIAHQRVRQGWSPEEAATRPLHARRPHDRVAKVADFERAERHELRKIADARHEAARIAGRLFYERGSPCKNCGGRTNYVSSKTCAACVNSRAAARYECVNCESESP